jgi:hypothetical protein
MSAQPRATRELCIMACVFCRDPVFQKWSSQQAPTPIWQDKAVNRERDAKAFILTACNISSRNELDGNPEAARLFHSLIRVPFLEFKNSEGQ